MDSRAYSLWNAEYERNSYRTNSIVFIIQGSWNKEKEDNEFVAQLYQEAKSLLYDGRHTTARERIGTNYLSNDISPEPERKVYGSAEDHPL